jgi:HD superfamily phosphodiesterase
MSKSIVKRVEQFAKEYCSKYSGDPKLWENHVQLVRKYALKLAKIEKCDHFVVEIASLLHDIGKFKGREGHTKRSYELSKKFLREIDISNSRKDLILDCIRKHDNKHSQKENKTEVKVVQCADALGTLFDDEWQERSRKTIDKETLFGLFDKTYGKITLNSAKEIAKPQVEKLKKKVRSLRDQKVDP